MNEDYRKAREWAEEILAFPETAYPSQSMVAKVLLELLPKQTMADVEWDDDAHHLAGATTPDGQDAVMMWFDGDESELIMCVDAAWSPGQLTPNGKQYELREVTVSSNENIGLDQPEHPTVLKTEEDFEDAPNGTIVAKSKRSASTKFATGEWGNPHTRECPQYMAECGPWTVLRWGWGE